jgi:DNA helicase HerA-like ATPase
MYWAILHRAGYPANIGKLKGLMGVDPQFNQGVRCSIYGVGSISQCPTVNSLDALAEEFERCAEADRDTKLKSTSGKDLFDADDRAILGFLRPVSLTSAGPKIIQAFRKYHDPNAGDFVEEIIKLLDNGKTVIIDLGNAPPEVTNYFSVYLSKAIFHNQVDKFSNDKLGNHYLQLYFEEAHNIFPSREQDEVDIYRRIAKEGAKFNIGMVYSTQSPTTINKDLLAQTENFFVAHLSSQDEVNALARVNTAYESLKDDILRARTVGYIRMLTRSHRFVVSMQALKFTPPTQVS